MPFLGPAITATVSFLGSGTALATLAKGALLLGASFGLSALTRPKLKGNQAKELIVRSGSAPKQIVYGEAVVAGVLQFMNQKPISGDKNYELWVGLVHAAGEVNDITDLYYDSDELTSGGEITWSGAAPNITSDVNSGPWHADDGTHEACTVWKFLGTSTQSLPADFIAAFPELTSAHRLRGYAGTSPPVHHL